MATKRMAPISGPAALSRVTLAVLSDESVVAFERSALTIKAEVEALAVVDEPSKARAGDAVIRIRRALREADVKRGAIVKPHNDHVAAVNAYFKRILTPLVEADGMASGRVLTYDREQRQRAIEAAAEAERLRLAADALLRQAEKTEAEALAAPPLSPERQALPAVADALATQAADADSGARDAQAQAVLPSRSVRTESGTASTQKRWTYEVVDLARVPREFLVLDSGKVRERINAAVRDGQSPEAMAVLIDGLRCYQAEHLATRA